MEDKYQKLIGMKLEEAQNYLAENVTPGDVTYFLYENAIVTADYRTDRVRIWIDVNTKHIVGYTRG